MSNTSYHIQEPYPPTQIIALQFLGWYLSILNLRQKSAPGGAQNTLVKMHPSAMRIIFNFGEFCSMEWLMVFLPPR
jgi:hypothetical protein